MSISLFDVEEELTKKSILGEKPRSIFEKYAWMLNNKLETFSKW